MLQQNFVTLRCVLYNSLLIAYLTLNLFLHNIPAPALNCGLRLRADSGINDKTPGSDMSGVSLILLDNWLRLSVLHYVVEQVFLHGHV